MEFKETFLWLHSHSMIIWYLSLRHWREQRDSQCIPRVVIWQLHFSIINVGVKIMEICLCLSLYSVVMISWGKVIIIKKAIFWAIFIFFFIFSIA